MKDRFLEDYFQGSRTMDDHTNVFHKLNWNGDGLTENVFLRPNAYDLRNIRKIEFVATHEFYLSRRDKQTHFVSFFLPNGV